MTKVFSYLYSLKKDSPSSMYVRKNMTPKCFIEFQEPNRKSKKNTKRKEHKKRTSFLSLRIILKKVSGSLIRRSHISLDSTPLLRLRVLGLGSIATKVSRIERDIYVYISILVRHDHAVSYWVWNSPSRQFRKHCCVFVPVFRCTYTRTYATVVF